jgi:peptide/nickel transport system ATP-binding protein
VSGAFSDQVRIDIAGVSKFFGSRRSRVTAVDDVSFTVDSTSMVGVIGESGSGKSTLARLMVGLDEASIGTVSFNGRDIALLSRSERLDFRRSVQMVAQDTSSSFDPRLTLRDALRAPAQHLCDMTKEQADDRADRVLELVSLSPSMANRRPNEVSGGQRQRFALARALVVEPRLLVCDEVVSALDVSVQGSILNLLKRYCREHSAGVVFVSHGLPATAFMADDMVVMHLGRIVEHGQTSQLLEGGIHPYTAQLLGAHRGRPASPTEIDLERTSARTSWACKYATSCSRAIATCETDRPMLNVHGHVSVACHRPLEEVRVPTGATLGTRHIG